MQPVGPAIDLISAQPTNRNWPLSSVFWSLFTSGSFGPLDLSNTNDTGLKCCVIFWLFPRGWTLYFPVLGFLLLSFACEHFWVKIEKCFVGGKAEWRELLGKLVCFCSSIFAGLDLSEPSKSLSSLCTIASTLWFVLEILCLALTFCLFWGGKGVLFFMLLLFSESLGCFLFLLLLCSKRLATSVSV